MLDFKRPLPSLQWVEFTMPAVFVEGHELYNVHEGVVRGCIIALFHSWLEGPVAQPEPIVLGHGPMTWEGRAELRWHNSDASVRPGWLGYEDLNSHTWTHAFLDHSYCKVMSFSDQRNIWSLKLEAMLYTYKTQLRHNNIVTYKLVP